MIGETVAHYHVTTKLGEGGIGEVPYRCRRRSRQRQNRISSRPIAFESQRGSGMKTQKKENRTAPTARMIITTGA
jgi:hypothetical protein